MKKSKFLIVALVIGCAPLFAQQVFFRAQKIALSPNELADAPCIQLGVFMRVEGTGMPIDWNQVTVDMFYDDPDGILSGDPVAMVTPFVGVNVGVEPGLTDPATPLPNSMCLAADITNTADLFSAEADFMPALDPDETGGSGFVIETVNFDTLAINLTRLDTSPLFETVDGVEYLVGIVSLPIQDMPALGSRVTLRFNANAGKNIINRTATGPLDAVGNTTDGFFEVGPGSVEDGIGLFNPNTNGFFLRSVFANGPADISYAFGPAGAGWTPLAGDWNGDGVTTNGLYDPVGGTFYLRNVFSGGSADVIFNFGTPMLIPVIGDWDGDGVDSVGVFNQTTSVFFLKNSLSGGASDIDFKYGSAGNGYRPITGDWNGDGIDTIGLYDPVNRVFFLKNSFGNGPADVTFSFGAAGWTPIFGDWNGDGVDTVGVYDPIAGAFFLRNVMRGGAADAQFRFGPAGAGWTPLNGNWDGL